MVLGVWPSDEKSEPPSGVFTSKVATFEMFNWTKVIRLAPMAADNRITESVFVFSSARVEPRKITDQSASVPEADGINGRADELGQLIDPVDSQNSG